MHVAAKLIVRAVIQKRTTFLLYFSTIIICFRDTKVDRRMDIVKFYLWIIIFIAILLLIACRPFIYVEN